jgi:hypothetical protein
MSLILMGNISNILHDTFNIQNSGIISIGCSFCNSKAGSVTLINITDLTNP